MRQKVADEYVAMRMAELVATGQFVAVMDRALASHKDNTGCQALAEQASFLRSALERVSG